MKDWLPRSISSLRDYSWHKFAADALAGVTVGLVALPLAMAFAIASGVAPQAGLYCAIVAGFLISALEDPPLKSAVLKGHSSLWCTESSAGTGWTACSCARSWQA